MQVKFLPVSCASAMNHFFPRTAPPITFPSKEHTMPQAEGGNSSARATRKTAPGAKGSDLQIMFSQRLCASAVKHFFLEHLRCRLLPQ